MSIVSSILFVILTSLFSGESIPAGSSSPSLDEERVANQKNVNISDVDTAIMPMTAHMLLEGNAE